MRFFRGNWCPFCSLELQALNKSFDKLQSKGFGLIAISPQTTQYNKEIKKNLKLNFEILSDAKSQYTKELGIDFTLQDYAVPHYKALGIDLKKLNADDQNRLPIPAVFVIDSNKVIKYKFVDSNYMNRVNIEELFTIE
ncbi:peroxiredoxin-like family protein [Bacteroides propionicifaciens]|uniref:peroxiredoxin-like family protein n=1 Tax=Bacteroides propionicifaciens TaxID=392838 RepID=UPI000687F55D|nr:peroxiredoxin-like family protein [Bacteroides propionicifaciens]